MLNPTIPVSPGELLDKITILEIKTAQIRDPAKLANVRHELALLNDVWNTQDNIQTVDGERVALKRVNEALWQIEDDIRLKERDQAFDDGFIALARSVYVRNDERATLKREINRKLGSDLVEEKSYEDYTPKHASATNAD